MNDPVERHWRNETSRESDDQVFNTMGVAFAAWAKSISRVELS